MHLRHIILLGPPAALAAFALAASARHLLLRHPKRFCPGPRRSLWLQPILQLRGRTCGYDLHAAPPGLDGSITCPECGRNSHPRALRRIPHVSRSLRVGAVLAALAAAMWIVDRCTTIDAVRVLPTRLLILAESLLDTYTPRDVRSEVRRRFDDGEIAEAHIPAIIPLFIRDLRSDAIFFNADSAIDRLHRCGPAITEPLLATLDSPDWQQRHYAADIARDLMIEPPPDRLLAVSVEGLQDDIRRYGAGRAGPATVWLFNAHHGFRYLVKHPGLGHDHLAQALQSSDAQQRFLAAAILGLTASTPLMQQAAPILIEHLGENDISDDAVLAINALYRFGQPLLPLLVEHAQTSDPQRRASLEYLIWRLRADAGEPAGPRPRLPALTNQALDPLNINLEWIELPDI
jgi:hypothetical protein